MIRNDRHIAILNILRVKQFQLRNEFYRNAEKVYDNSSHGETILYMAIRTLESKGCVSIDRIGEGRRTRIVSIRLTERGLVDLERREVAEKNHKEQVHSAIKKRPVHIIEEIPQPCGVVKTRCYHQGCYLEYKCPLKQKL